MAGFKSRTSGSSAPMATFVTLSCTNIFIMIHFLTNKNYNLGNTIEVQNYKSHVSKIVYTLRAMHQGRTSWGK